MYEGKEKLSIESNFAAGSVQEGCRPNLPKDVRLNKRCFDFSTYQFLAHVAVFPRFAAAAPLLSGSVAILVGSEKVISKSSFDAGRR